MTDLKVCRICLCKGVKVYNYDSFHLKQYYEEIMARKVNEKDGLPNYFCYECAAVLYKFHKFKEKCWMGEIALKELLCSGSITLTSISQIDRQDKNLQSPIDIVTVSKRVKTYIIKNKTISNNLLEEIQEDEIPEIETYVIEYDSDDSLDAKNVAEINNENMESIEDGKTNIDIGISKEEKAIPDLEEHRKFSDDDDSNSEYVNDVTHEATNEEISDEITVEEEGKNVNREQANSDTEIVLNENHKQKKRKKNKAETDISDTKAKKFEVSNTKKNYLDPNHWLKINLTEEEALEDFKARAQDRKYVSAAYKCSDCYKGFSKEDMLNRHIKSRHSESRGPVECRFCKMRFKWKGYLTDHITQHYTKYKCLRCDLVCPLKGSALFHNDYHNGVIRKCIHCGDEFRHLSTYYSHLRTHRSEYVCTICGASFVSASGLNMHKKRTMHINTVVNPEEGVTQTDTYCERCDIKFETRKAYQEHVFHSAKHTEAVGALVCETPAPSVRGKKGIRRDRRICTPCTICNRNFKSLTAYTKHRTEDHKDVPLPSKEDQRQICEICGASLALGSLPNHMNSHTREKLYTCKTCGRQFSSSSGMTTHQLTHTHEKPVACTLCDKRFKQSSSMKLHYRTYHLKEPYPKRNRKRKIDALSKDEDSDDNMTLDNFNARK